MKQNLSALKPNPKTGREPFTNGKRKFKFVLNDFWSWLGSDLIGNTMRGRLAEFIIARALRVRQRVRTEWASYDLVTPEGIRIEVKSAAYLQSWDQDTYSTIQFNVEKRRALNARTGLYSGKPKRHAHVYVFALLAAKDKQRVNPLNVLQWHFYVLPTAKLNRRKRSQHSITLKSLEDETKRYFTTNSYFNYRELRKAVLRAGKS
jgi:hypothetical protein